LYLPFLSAPGSRIPPPHAAGRRDAPPGEHAALAVRVSIATEAPSGTGVIIRARHCARPPVFRGRESQAAFGARGLAAKHAAAQNSARVFRRLQGEAAIYA